MSIIIFPTFGLLFLLRLNYGFPAAFGAEELKAVSPYLRPSGFRGLIL